MEAVLFIGLGGFLGANARYLVSTWLTRWLAGYLGAEMPLATLCVNLSGSFLLALFLGLASSRLALSPNVRLFVATGFFGAYTTFSTYASETLTLFQNGNWHAALGNILASNVLALAGALLGLLVASRLSA